MQFTITQTCETILDIEIVKKIPSAVPSTSYNT